MTSQNLSSQELKFSISGLTITSFFWVK